jgi:hypothetical protein
MPHDDLSQYSQQQYDFVKSYLVCASLGCAVLITALYVAATTLWCKLKQRNKLDDFYHKKVESAKSCPKPSLECAALIQPGHAQQLRMEEINSRQEHAGFSPQGNAAFADPSKA